MKVQSGYFYFIKDNFFEEIKDKELMGNKENGHMRPCYYCFKDNRDNGLYWFIPVSSKKEIYIKQNKEVTVNEELKKELNIKANRVLELVRAGKKNLVFPDIINIEKILLKSENN